MTVHSDRPQCGPDEIHLDRLATQAVDIAWRIHDQDPAGVWAEAFALDELGKVQLICALAAMVDIDRTPADLLAWTGEQRQIAMPDGCGRCDDYADCANCAGLFRPTLRRKKYCSATCFEAACRRRWRANSARRYTDERERRSA